jgi:O-methyltransferase domain/Dimerisation domain
MAEASRQPSPANEPGERPSATLARLINGFQVTQAIHVAATLELADALTEGPATSEELAAAKSVEPGSLYRLMRALASIGVFREDEQRRFTLTPLGDCLRTDAPESLAGWAAFVGRQENWEAWGNLLHSVQTGENAFHSVHGMGVWQYRSDRPDESAVFDRAMESMTSRVHGGLVAAYDFGRFETIADVGGGNGSLLAAVLAEYPAIRGILFDEAHVVAKAGPVLARAGVADRCEVVAGDFFEEVPPADAHLLKSILHDWEDAQASAILRSCLQAAGPEGVVLAIERLIGPPNEGPDAKLSDLNMLVAPGGRERTLDEFRALFVDAGWELLGSTALESGFNVIEAKPSRR